jgi:hypothetical protein
MGEPDEVVPPLKISPQGPVETGRRAGDPGPRNRSLASVEGPARAPGDHPAAAPVAARRRPGSPFHDQRPGRGCCVPSPGSCSLPACAPANGGCPPCSWRWPWSWDGWRPRSLPPRPRRRVEARTAVVMDAATGAVLWQRQAHKPVLVASTTKILTAIVANDAYPARKLFKVPRRRAGRRHPLRLPDRLVDPPRPAAHHPAAGLGQRRRRDPGRGLARRRPGRVPPGHAGQGGRAGLHRHDLARPLRAWTPPATGRAPPTWPCSAGPCWSGRCWPSWSVAVGRGTSGRRPQDGPRQPQPLRRQGPRPRRPRGQDRLHHQGRLDHRCRPAARGPHPDCGRPRLRGDVRRRARPARLRLPGEAQGRRRAPRPAPRPARGRPDPTLPPATDRITGPVSGVPSPLVERLGVRILAAPVPLAACAGVACLAFGALALFWRRR